MKSSGSYKQSVIGLTEPYLTYHYNVDSISTLISTGKFTVWEINSSKFSSTGLTFSKKIETSSYVKPNPNILLNEGIIYGHKVENIVAKG